MNKKNSKIKKVVIEVVVIYAVVNMGFLWWLGNVPMAVVAQFVALYIGDFAFRKELVRSKRRRVWNIGCGLVKVEALLLTLYVHPLNGILCTIFAIIADRIMFFEGKDRTVETVDEVKEVCFLPLMTNIKNRAIYVLNGEDSGFATGRK